MVSSEGSPSFHAQKINDSPHSWWKEELLYFFEVSRLVLYHPRQLPTPNNLHDGPVSIPSSIMWARRKNQGAAAVHP